MIPPSPFYWESIRKINIAFSSIFSDIKIQRKERTGEKLVIQTVNVPIANAGKEKWVQRSEQDPELENQIYTVLPKMSFEMLGLNYDSARKISKLNKITCRTETGGTSVYAPVPYNLEYNLYILTKTNEDCYQIIEQILPYFSPEYTVSINLVPDTNIVQDLPFVLNSVTIDDDYEGDFQTRRTVTGTLNFTVKTNFYGPAGSSGLIKKVIINLDDNIGVYTASEETPVSPIIESFKYD